MTKTLHKGFLSGARWSGSTASAGVAPMGSRTLVLALLLTTPGLAFVHASHITSDPYWYCDGDDSNDPQPSGTPGNVAPADADRSSHRFGPQPGTNVVVYRSDGDAYSSDSADTCTSQELTLTDGDGELENGVRTAVFSISDAHDCGGYGNGHHGAPREAGAENIVVPVYLAFHTGTDGYVHLPDDPMTAFDERAIPAFDPCVGNGVITNDPATDGHDCTSNTGWSFGGVVVEWATPLPIDSGLAASCDSVDDTQTIFLDAGVMLLGGPFVEGRSHPEKLLGWAMGHEAGFWATCTKVDNDPEEYYGQVGAPAQPNPWHSECATYLDVDLGPSPTIAGISVPIEGWAGLR